MSAERVKYRLDEFGKITKIWGEGDVVSIPEDLDVEATQKLWEPNQRWTFDNVFFENCRFDFTNDAGMSYVFIGCVFLGCDMSGVDPSRAVLTGEVAGCINVRGSSCPPSGDFTGYKIAYDVWTGEPVLITLYVPKEAERRGNGFDKKFRVSCAHVVDMRFADGENCQRAYSGHNAYFCYSLNDIVHPEVIFDRRHATCASGIHMFLDPEDAINYGRTWRTYKFYAPRYFVIGQQGSAEAWDMMTDIRKEDGACPYPERLEMEERGDWSWVEAERKDR